MNPHFYRLRKGTVLKDLVPGRATERCERDFLRLVLWVSYGNAIPQRTVMAVPSNGLNMPRMCGDPALRRFGENGGRQGQSMGSLPSFVKLNRNVVGEQMAPS